MVCRYLQDLVALIFRLVSAPPSTKVKFFQFIFLSAVETDELILRYICLSLSHAHYPTIWFTVKIVGMFLRNASLSNVPARVTIESFFGLAKLLREDSRSIV